MSERAPIENPPEANEKNWLALLSSTEVFGPFTYTELKGYVDSGQIASTAQFFRRETSMEEAEAQVASLMRRAAEAEGRVRGAEAEAARLGADVKAKDLEFESERQQMSADVAKLRAEIVRRDAEIATLRKAVERLDALEKDRLGLETKSLEADRRGQEWKAKAERLESEVEALRQAHQDRGRRLGELAASLRAIADEAGPAAQAEAEDASARHPGLSKKPLRAAAGAAVEEAVVVDPDPPPADTPSNGARLASLEAQAQQELARLRARNGGAMPRWGRKQA